MGTFLRILFKLIIFEKRFSSILIMNFVFLDGTDCRMISRRRINITQAPGHDSRLRTRHGVTLGGLHTAAERDTVQPAAQEQSNQWVDGGGWGAGEERGRGRCDYTPQKRCDWAG